MKVRIHNCSRATLGLPSVGELRADDCGVDSGKYRDVSPATWDEISRNRVVSAWLKAGTIRIEQEGEPEAKAETKPEPTGDATETAQPKRKKKAKVKV